ncbi:MAG: ParB/RepB/Spo0J family partition protein [Anaerotruncus sp.]|nr:ParB/RepB/Spo0J family partition protein [Anaerotruncus sp.]
MKFDDQTIDELAQSIKETGIVQPVIVAPEDDHYKIIVGERRWRAAQKAGLRKIPVLIRNIPKDKQLEVSLIENIHREELNALEIAQAYQRLIDEHGYAQHELADKVGKDRSSVTNYLRLLKLPQEIQDTPRSTARSRMGHARALLALEDPATQLYACRQVIDRSLSVRNTEALVNRLKKKAPRAQRSLADPDLHALQEEMLKILGTKVLVAGSRNKGVLKIYYFSLDDLEPDLRPDQRSERMKDKPRELNETKLAGLIDMESEFKGELTFKGSFRIEGTFKGTINSDSLLVVGERGKVEADVKVGQLVINGEIRGTLEATERVEVHDKGRVFGTILAPDARRRRGRVPRSDLPDQGRPRPGGRGRQRTGRRSEPRPARRGRATPTRAFLRLSAERPEDIIGGIISRRCAVHDASTSSSPAGSFRAWARASRRPRSAASSKATATASPSRSSIPTSTSTRAR